MGKGFKDKNCKQCGILMINVNSSKLLCDDCRDKNTRDSWEKRNAKLKPKYTEEEYKDNFLSVAKEPYILTTRGFDSVSEISFHAYRNYFKMTWCEVVKMYGKLDELYDYIINEYKNYYNETGSQNISAFGQKYHQYITYDILDWFTTDKIMSDCGIKKLKYTDEDYENNFNKLRIKLGKIPLFHEFEKYSDITLEGYIYRYKLNIDIYDTIVKRYVTEEEFKQYLIDKRNYRSELGQETGKLAAVYTLEELEIEFKRVYDYCLSELKTPPTVDYFDRVSKFDNRMFRKRLNMTWGEVCEHYGYEYTPSTANKAEKMVLDIISTILESRYKPQKTWKWLKGINGKSLRCDGFYEKVNLVVEFDGEQHRRPVAKFGGEEAFKILQANDEIKNKLIPYNGIKLIRIQSNEPWHDIDFLTKLLIENNIPIKKEFTKSAS